MRLVSSQSYSITVSGTASFGTVMTATAGGNRGGAGGTATGGDYNYTGEVGEDQSDYTKNEPARAGGVGVAIVGLTQFLSASASFSDGASFTLNYGGSLMGHGGGGSAVAHLIDDLNESGNRKAYAQTGQSAAVIIRPLEMEE